MEEFGVSVFRYYLFRQRNPSLGVRKNLPGDEKIEGKPIEILRKTDSAKCPPRPSKTKKTKEKPVSAMGLTFLAPLRRDISQSHLFSLRREHIRYEIIALYGDRVKYSAIRFPPKRHIQIFLMILFMRIL